MNIKTLEAQADKELREERERIAKERIKRLKEDIRYLKKNIRKAEWDLEKVLATEIDDIELGEGQGQRY